MIDRSITIRNVYVMLAYAFRTIRREGHDRVASERFERLHELFAEILIRGVGAQVKRGIHRDYRSRRDELATVRGRIDVPRTVAARSLTRARLVCEFDEYEPDTPHNRALKAVLVLLIRQGDLTAARRVALRRLLPYLDSVTTVSPTSVQWSTLSYHRANADYRLLLGVCELIVKGMLQTEDSGDAKLASWVADEQMSRLYERFLLEYFRVHHPALAPSASKVAWDYDLAVSQGTHQLPAMQSDVTLRRSGRTLIIDAKYYGQSMQTSAWGKTSVHSPHLYQVLSYVKNADVAHDGSVSGLLLYARTDAVEQPDLDVVIQGNRIGARTLDLGQPWDRLRSQLDHIATWLGEEQSDNLSDYEPRAPKTSAVVRSS